MKKLILASALGASVLMLSACGDSADDATADAEADAAAADAAAVDVAAAGAAAEDPNWPSGTRIVEEGGTTYRVNADGSRVELADTDWRIVTEGETRYRVNPSGTRVEIDEEGLDLDGVASGPDVPGVDVDVGTNEDDNLDVDISTDGDDATPNN